MYRYDSIDQTLVEQRVAEFRDQTRRFLAGRLSERDRRLLVAWESARHVVVGPQSETGEVKPAA